ncbi:hypothetical protein [Mycolicibacterium hippocampi]|uniref:hypothetical protein n=1 Tax=Mycolicibacterium hippocampi TaxID=659824 RepID=UPI0035147CE4
MTTDEGELANLCAVRNGCSRRVLRWAVEDHLRTALSMTMRGMLPRKVIFHADRGALRTKADSNLRSQFVVIASVVDRLALPPVFSSRALSGAAC